MNHYASLLRLLITTARLASRCLEKELGRVGIAPGHVPVYLALADKLSMTQKELAVEADVEQPTMALTLARMERDGLVSRKPNPDDGRSMLYNLTASAHAQIADVESALSVVDRRVAALLKTQELVAVRSALELIGAGLTDERQDAADKSKKATTHKPGEQAITSTPASGDLESSTSTELTSTPQKPKFFREPGTETEFPMEFEITTSWKKKTFIATVADEGWVLHEDGEISNSLPALSVAVFGDRRNPWMDWKYKSEKGRHKPLYVYRLEKR